MTIWSFVHQMVQKEKINSKRLGKKDSLSKYWWWLKKNVNGDQSNDTNLLSLYNSKFSCFVLLEYYGWDDMAENSKLKGPRF